MPPADVSVRGYKGSVNGEGGDDLDWVCFFHSLLSPNVVLSRARFTASCSKNLFTQAILRESRFPMASANFSSVDSLMSSAWFSMRDMADFFV